MDPASTVALVASGLTIVTKTLTNLHDLATKLSNAEHSVQMIIGKMSTLRAALSQLVVFLESESTQSFITPQLQSDLVSSMHPCTVVMSIIDQHVSQIRTGCLRGTVRYVWDEGAIKEHCLHLDSQVSALNLLLQVIQLSSANEQRAILAKQQNRRLLRRAHDDASSYYSKSILSSPSRRDTVEFEFENQLIDSAAYRSAYRKYTNSERASASHAADRKTGDVMTRETSRQESLAATDECSISETLKGEMKSKNKISAFSWWRTEGMHSNTTRKRKLYTLLGAMVFIIVVVLATVIPIVVMRARNLNPSPTTTGAPTSPSGAPEPSSSTRWSSIAGYPPLPLGAWSLTSGVVRIEETSECARPATAWSCFTPNGNAPTNTKEVPIFHFNITAESDTSETPTPSIPDDMDYRFLGNNTDQTTTPFEGLNTPFSISFLSPSASQQRKRAEITDAIPPPSLQSDGRIAQPSLLPIPTAQPLRLFDKGLDSEHYGFYVYFDKTILLHSINQSIETDEGGASPESAKFAVTWAETRFRVSIGTKNLQREVSNGEFPLSTTFLLDRHGGAPERKMLYAYGFLDDSKVNETDKVFLLEDRAWGGTQVNPAGGSIPFTHSDAGGFDGGSGGCNCVWKYIPE